MKSIACGENTFTGIRQKSSRKSWAIKLLKCKTKFVSLLESCRVLVKNPDFIQDTCTLMECSKDNN